MKPSFAFIAALLLTGTVVSMTACVGTKQPKTMTADPNTSLFPKGEKLTNDYFTGNAYLTPLVARDKNNEYAMGNVTFEPGARTNRSAVRWHTHPKGQVLIVTEGSGFYQEKGKPARRINKGDVVNIPEAVEHWHGASATNKLVHIAITNYQGDDNVVWLTPVSDDDYTKVNSH
ncbi:(R)-mandelonitrile lyase [Spirosoma agri]|nr:cupin domain-containing protein [Spirosoma agri]